MTDFLFTDADARLRGTFLVMEPFLDNRTELEAALLIFIAEHHGVTAAIQLLLTWEQEEKKWNQGEGVLQ